MSGRFLIADRVDARLFAYIAETRFTEHKVSTSRLSASLTPFPDAASAEAALIEAGGSNIREAGR